jgi:NADPH:quinone reductase-like Zn-dependent oxidoreductase
MKAYEINEFGIEKLALAERPEPRPADGEVVIRIRAVSLNYRDVMVASGTYNPRMKLPAVPLSDAAGEIVETGRNAGDWKVGDRVMPIFVQRWFDGPSTDENRRTALGAGPQWDGVLREYAAFDHRAIVRVPESMSWEEAATLPCAPVTAWNALAVSGRLKAGETVVTLGTGGVSVFAVQIAKMFGARVIATTSSTEKAERLRAIGADEVINYREREDWNKAVIELTGGIGADHVVEVGGAGTLSRSVNAVRVGGHIALIGALAEPAAFDPVQIFMRSVRVQGIFVGSRRMFHELLAAITLHKLRPVIDEVFPFADARDALGYMQSGSHFGKIVIRVVGEE